MKAAAAHHPGRCADGDTPLGQQGPGRQSTQIAKKGTLRDHRSVGQDAGVGHDSLTMNFHGVSQGQSPAPVQDSHVAGQNGAISDPQLTRVLDIRSSEHGVIAHRRPQQPEIKAGQRTHHRKPKPDREERYLDGASVDGSTDDRTAKPLQQSAQRADHPDHQQKCDQRQNKLECHSHTQQFTPAQRRSSHDNLCETAGQRSDALICQKTDQLKSRRNRQPIHVGSSDRRTQSLATRCSRNIPARLCHRGAEHTNDALRRHQGLAH